MTKRKSLPSGHESVLPKKNLVRADFRMRAEQGWHLRVAGRTWVEIAERLGYSTGQNAQRAVTNYMKALPEVDQGQARAVAEARSETLWSRAWDKVEQSDGSPAAVRAAVDVLKHQSALQGTNAPTKVQYMPSDDELGQWLGAVLRTVGTPLPVEADIFDARYYADEDDVVDAEIVADDEFRITVEPRFTPPNDGVDPYAVQVSPADALKRLRR